MGNSGKVEALIPRCLFSIENSDNLNIDFEELCAISISWENGFVSELKPLNIGNKKPNKIIFPRFVEAHSHIDKSFTWDEFPNLRSTYDGALSVNLEEHKTRSTKKVLERAEKSLTKKQKSKIEKYCRIVSSPIHNIEDSAGGSVRCMIAEIALPKK